MVTRDGVPGLAMPHEHLAPTGTLRIAVWMLPYFAFARPGGSELDGVIPELGREFARRLGVGATLVRFADPASIVEAFRAGEVDVTFIGITADRATAIDFGPTVIDIETSYLVPAGSAIGRIDEVDRAGVRIAVPRKSAQQAHLQATLTQATMVAVPPETPQQAIDLLRAGRADVFSHVVPMLAAVSAHLPGARILPGSTYNVPIAIGHRRGGSSAAVALCKAFVEEVIASGFVQQAIDRMGDAARGLVPHAASSRR
jgi:polar amino acid transport system substrate-binding protein